MKKFALTIMLLLFASPAMTDDLVEFGRKIARVNALLAYLDTIQNPAP